MPGALADIGRRAAQALAAQEAQCRRALGITTYNSLALLLRNTFRTTGFSWEDMLVANFETQYRKQQLSHDKLYGLWGLAHVVQSPIQGNFRSLAAQLRQGPLLGKVVSVLCVFSGCQMLFPTAGLIIPWQTVGQPYSITDKFNHDGPLSVLTGLAANQPHFRPHSIGHRAA